MRVQSNQTLKWEWTLKQDLKMRGSEKVRLEKKDLHQKQFEELALGTQAETDTQPTQQSRYIMIRR